MQPVVWRITWADDDADTAKLEDDVVSRVDRLVRYAADRPDADPGIFGLPVNLVASTLHATPRHCHVNPYPGGSDDVVHNPHLLRSGSSAKGDPARLLPSSQDLVADNMQVDAFFVK